MNLNFGLLAVFQLVFFQPKHCEGYIWNYALSQTMSEGSYQDTLHHPRNIFHNTIEEESDDGENETKQNWMVITGLHTQNAYTNLGTSCHNVHTKFFCLLLMHISRCISR